MRWVDLAQAEAVTLSADLSGTSDDGCGDSKGRGEADEQHVDSESVRKGLDWAVGRLSTS